MAKDSIAFFLIILSFILKIAPISAQSYLPIPPDNLLYLVIILFLYFDLKSYLLVFTNRKVRNLILIYISYFLLQWVYRIFFENETFNFGEIIKNFIFITFIIYFINKYNIIMLLNFLYILLISELLFSILIFYFGEPFSMIRMKLIDNIEYKYVSLGTRPYGFQNSIFAYSYPLTIIPILSILFFKLTNNRIYLVLFLFSLLGVILNGERATLVFSLLGVIYLLIKLYKGIKVLFGFSLIILCIVVADIVYFDKTLNNDDYVLNRLKNSNEEETSNRLNRQVSAILTILKNPFEPANIDTYENIIFLKGGNYFASPHNTYVNTGLQIGIWGWIILFSVLLRLRKICLSNKEYFQKAPYNYLSSALNISFISVLAVGLFHNPGLFTFEYSTLFIFSFILALYSNRKIKVTDRI